jgi:hypothetical protein
MRFFVNGICFVPHKVTAFVDATNAAEAEAKLKKSDWKESIDINSGDFRAAFGLDVLDCQIESKKSK